MLLSPFGLAPELLQRLESFRGESIGDAGAERHVGGAGEGRQLIEEVCEVARDRAGGSACEGGALEGEVRRVNGVSIAVVSDETFYDIIGRLAESAVNNTDRSPGTELCAAGVGTPGRVEDDYYLPARPPRRFEGVVDEELARTVEATGLPRRVTLYSTDEIIAIQYKKPSTQPRCRLAS